MLNESKNDWKIIDINLKNRNDENIEYLDLKKKNMKKYRDLNTKIEIIMKSYNMSFENKNETR